MSDAKKQLGEQKALLLRQLAECSSPLEHAAVQAEITAVNASIKAINVAEGARLKAIADQKRIANRQRQATDLRAVADRMKSSTPAPREISLGEEVIIHAKRLRRILREIPEAKRLVFTTTFLGDLDTFIELQKSLIKQPSSAADAASIDEDTWRKAWTVPQK